MKNTKQAPIVISVGGSLIVPDQIDTDFLKKFTELIKKEVAKGKRFIVICGGGKTARRYQESASAVTKLRSSDIDWIGIHATRLNAHLVKTLLVPHAEEVIVKDPYEKISFKKRVLVAAGWKPGWSTDYDAVLLAKRFGAKKMINLSNIDYVYDKDPRTNTDAKKIEKINWKEFRKIIPKKWDPGLSSPFDPIASREAEKQKIEVAIMNGKNVTELKRCIEGESFEGTLIR